jgi:hypothetical protein
MKSVKQSHVVLLSESKPKRYKYHGIPAVFEFIFSCLHPKMSTPNSSNNNNNNNIVKEPVGTPTGIAAKIMVM